MDDDDNFFSRLDHDNDPFQNRLRNAPHDDNDVPMPVAPRLLEEDEEETPLQQLIRHWMNERHAPDILPVAGDVLAGLLDHIRRQVGSSCSQNERDLRFRRGLITFGCCCSPRPFSCCCPILRPLRRNTFGSCSLRQRSSGSSLSSGHTSVRGCSRCAKCFRCHVEAWYRPVPATRPNHPSRSKSLLDIS